MLSSMRNRPGVFTQSPAKPVIQALCKVRQIYVAEQTLRLVYENRGNSGKYEVQIEFVINERFRACVD